MKKWLKEWKILLIFLAVLFFVGIIGRFIPYGDKSWNFVFENMIWFPFELALTIFVIQKMLDKNVEKQKAMREFAEYYSVAQSDIENILATFKLGLITIATNQDCEPEKRNEKIEEIRNNIDKYFSPERIKAGFQAPIVDFSNVLDSIQNVKYTRKSFFYVFESFGEDISKNVRDHLSLFLRFIPLDIFNLLNSMLKYSEKSIFLTIHPMSKKMREFLISRENSGDFQESEYEDVSNVFKEIFITYYDYVKKIEIIIDNSKKSNR